MTSTLTLREYRNDKSSVKFLVKTNTIVTYFICMRASCVDSPWQYSRGRGWFLLLRSYSVTWRQNIEHQSGENSQRHEAPCDSPGPGHGRDWPQHHKVQRRQRQSVQCVPSDQIPKWWVHCQRHQGGPSINIYPPIRKMLIFVLQGHSQLSSYSHDPLYRVIHNLCPNNDPLYRVNHNVVL